MYITVRPATLGDAKMIALSVAMAMGEETAKEYCGKNYIEVLEEVAKREGTQYSYRHALVAMADDCPAGAIVGYDGALLQPLRTKTRSVIHPYHPQLSAVEDETEAGEFYLDSIGILPEFRGRGIGRSLLLAMKERAFAAGHPCVGLLVDVENPEAERLYLSLGFKQVGTKKFFGHPMKHLQAQSGSR